MRLSQLPTAAAVTNNPIGLVAEAVLPGNNIKGKVVVKSGDGGVGTQFNIELTNIPDAGPFSTFLT